MDGNIAVNHVGTKEQLADLLTKALAGPAFQSSPNFGLSGDVEVFVVNSKIIGLIWQLLQPLSSSTSPPSLCSKFSSRCLYALPFLPRSYFCSIQRK
jgi:hypothetical protein